MFKHGSTDIERDGHQIEVMIEMRSVLLPRYIIENNVLDGFPPGFQEVRQLVGYVLFPVVRSIFLKVSAIFFVYCSQFSLTSVVHHPLS